MISGQNANIQNPNTKNALPNPKHKSQWHFILWSFVCGSLTRYHSSYTRVSENGTQKLASAPHFPRSINADRKMFADKSLL